MGLKSVFKIIFLMAISILQVGCSVFGIRSEENPKYVVVQQSDDKEIRTYSAHIVASTTVSGDYKQAQRDAFKILAGYIFGGNEKKQRITMTAPVAVAPSAGGQSEKISMTAPVMVSGSAQGWKMTFMMPSIYRLEDLPTPNDKRIQFETVPAKTFGVIRFSGLENDRKNGEKTTELREWLGRYPQYKVIGSPIFAGFDPPWTIPFLRKNEMMLELL
jgi:hypothetical protein